MGLLVKGRWVDRWYDTASSGGRFVRSDSRFRHWVTPDGAPGPSGEAVDHGHFKCNLRRLINYPRLLAYARALFQVPGVATLIACGCTTSGCVRASVVDAVA